MIKRNYLLILSLLLIYSFFLSLSVMAEDSNMNCNQMLTTENNEETETDNSENPSNTYDDENEHQEYELQEADPSINIVPEESEDVN